MRINKNTLSSLFYALGFLFPILSGKYISRSLAVIVTNTLPILGMGFLDWEVKEVIFYHCLEFIAFLFLDVSSRVIGTAIQLSVEIPAFLDPVPIYLIFFTLSLVMAGFFEYLPPLYFVCIIFKTIGELWENRLDSQKMDNQKFANSSSEQKKELFNNEFFQTIVMFKKRILLGYFWSWKYYREDLENKVDRNFISDPANLTDEVPFKIF